MFAMFYARFYALDGFRPKGTPTAKPEMGG
jgi:hypothetical protein